MKKLLWLFSGLILLLVALFLGAPYYLGIKAEQSLNKQHEILSHTSFLQVESRRYERGWFSSHETTVVRFKPTFLAQLQDKLPDNIKTILTQPITLESNIKHSLFANGSMPVRAVVDTEFVFQPESREILQRFFGSQAPASLRNVIQLNGNGRLTWQVPAFKYQELSGIAINWQGLEGSTDYTKYFAEYQSSLNNPGLTITLADKGSVSYKNLQLHTETREGSHNLALGSSKLTLGQVEVEWKDSINYDIRLNDVLNMVSDLQIGSGKAAEFEFAVAADHALRGGEVELFEPDNGIVGEQAGGFVAQGGKQGFAHLLVAEALGNELVAAGFERGEAFGI